MYPRLLTHFTSGDGSVIVEFPSSLYEWESRQGLHVPVTQVIGADYAIDQLDASESPKDTSTEHVRGLLVEADSAALTARIIDLRSRAKRIGRGKLIARDSDGANQWAWGRLLAVPDISLTYINKRYAPFVASFIRLSDWYAEDETIHEEDGIDSEPHNFNVVNSGSATVRNAIIEFRSKGVNGFQALTLSSLSTGDEFSSTRAAQGSNSILRVDCGRRTVEYSNDGGATWTADYGNFSYGSKQVDFLRLEPGTNLLRYEQGTGTPNLDIVVSFYPAYD